MAKAQNGEGTPIDLWDKYGRKTKCRWQWKITKVINGKKYTKSANGKTQEEAKKRCKVKMNALKRSLAEPKSAKSSKPSKRYTFEGLLKEFMDDHGDGRWSPNTYISRYDNMKVVCNYLGPQDIKKITATEINETWKQILKTHCRKTVGMMYSLTNDYFEWLVEKNYLEINPYENGVKKLKNIKDKPETLSTKAIKEGQKLSTQKQYIYTDEEYYKLVTIALTCDDDSDINEPQFFYDICCFALIAQTGMRSQEARALLKKDIIWKEKCINIDKAVSLERTGGKIKQVIKEPKTKNSKRKILFNSQVATIIEKILTYHPQKDEPNAYLIANSKGDVIDKANFKRRFDKVCKRIGIVRGERCIHSLRHTFISLAIDKNPLSPLRNQTDLYISRYVGHANLTTTYNVYTHITGNKIRTLDNADFSIFDGSELLAPTDDIPDEVMEAMKKQANKNE